MGCPCKECSYFDGVDFCIFQKKPTTPDVLCWAKMYEFVELCESDDCSKCGHLNKDCVGDKKHPARELIERFHYGQGKALSSEGRIILISAGKQSGKTSMGALWMYHQMQIHGDGDYLAVSSSFPLMDKKLIPSYLEFFCAIGLSKPDDFLSAKKILKINGLGIKANIFFGSAKNASSLESSTALAAHLDEAGQDEFSSKAYDAVLGRLSRSGGKILISTTVYNLDWLYHRVYIPFTNGDTDYDVIQFESIMSPGFSKTQFEWLKKKLPAWQFDREYRGLFSRPTGMIYHDFRDYEGTDGHLIKPFTIPNKWNWHVGIDPGAVHTALVWIAEEPATNKYFIVTSSLEGNKTTKEHVKKAMQYHAFGKVIRWVGGAGSEDQFRMDWTNEGIHVREPEIRDVEAGIDRVTALLREKRLFIFNTDENARLIEEMRSYSRELDDQGQPTDRIKDKNKFHVCFIKGTGISTINGVLPIQEIKRGDLVLTTKGYFQVMEAGITQTNAEVYTVQLSNGKTLTGTGNHPIFVNGKGFVPIDTLRYGDSVCAQKLSYETKSYTEGTLNQRDEQTEYIINPIRSLSKWVRKHIFTNKYGKTHLVKYLLGILFTIVTVIPLIIYSLISNVFHSIYIYLTTIKNIISTILSKQTNILLKLDHLQLLGIVLQKAESGTLNMEQKHIKNENQSKRYATVVVKRSNQWLAAKQIAFVPTVASLHGDEKQDMIMKNEPVLFVGNNFKATNIQKSNIAPNDALHVVGVKRQRKRQTVYNITVDKLHEYFANGILVSNCDAIRYAFAGLGNIGDYSTPVVWQDTHIPSFDTIPDILREDAIPQFK